MKPLFATLILSMVAAASLAGSCKKRSRCGYTKVPEAFKEFKNAVDGGKVCMPFAGDPLFRVVYKNRSSEALAESWKKHIEKKLGYVVVQKWGNQHQYYHAVYRRKGDNQRVLTVSVVPTSKSQQRTVRLFWEKLRTDQVIQRAGK